MARDKWQGLSDTDRDYYETLARQDGARFARESHAADVAAIERREKLQNERSTVMLDMEEGPKRTTRKELERKHRKQAKVEKRQHKKKGSSSNGNGGDEKDFVEEDDESDSGSFDSEVLSDETDDSETKRKKKKPVPRQMTEKQIENRDNKKQEKQQKEQYIASRQEDLRKEKAGQAQRRLEFLLKQSNIFSHFGSVKEDTAKFGIKTAPVASKTQKDGELSSRRGAADGDDGDEDLEEVDEHEATRLTTQPSTLGHGQMRGYQLEGLNWMIRLQETGLNGILADEMGLGMFDCVRVFRTRAIVCCLLVWVLMFPCFCFVFCRRRVSYFAAISIQFDR
jgi:SWI/SNF-related matrix-associated actin-dependent regulator of chromatin subfamily A member 5